jgi:cytochrome bd-type quinol oxidase subunit 2
MKKQSEDPRLISYSYLRKAVGFLGLFLPIVLFLGLRFIADCSDIQPSISDYYHTKMRDVFVGVLCAISLFLYCYKGYAGDNRDNIAGTLASFFALGIAFFPTSFDGDSSCSISPATPNPEYISTLHFIFATAFFLVLAYFSLKLFTLGDSDTIEKQTRNKIYIICGYIMLGCIGAIALYFFYLKNQYPNLKNYDLVFWFETIALWAFATSWLVKGELILKDKSIRQEILYNRHDNAGNYVDFIA